MATNLPKQKTLIRPGVKALTVHQNKVLVIKEHVIKNGKTVDVNDFPGGGIEFGESLRETLIREVKEEVGLDINIKQVVGAWDFVMGELEHELPEKCGVQIVCIGYECSLKTKQKIDTTKNPAKEDIFEAKWYSKEELLANNGKMFGHPGMIEAIKKLNI